MVTWYISNKQKHWLIFLKQNRKSTRNKYTFFLNGNQIANATEYSYVWAQADHPLLVGAVVDWNLSNDFLLFIEEIHMNNTVIINCSKMQNLKQIFNKGLKKMLTESCVMFFSPSRAVLSAILRDEYLTSAVRTKEGDSFFSFNRRGQILISQNSA